jgi:hypothetical protein
MTASGLMIQSALLRIAPTTPNSQSFDESKIANRNPRAYDWSVLKSTY